jgi:hypothetical protein
MFRQNAKNVTLISTQTNISKMKSLVDWALENSGNAVRYRRRMTANPILAKLGCLPQELTKISNHQSPWFCHSLAFHMATYSDSYDYLFDRWETLLKLAQQADGWEDEYKRWSSSNNHWAKKWDKFVHFMWLLQCYEYFFEQGHNASFPVARKNQAMPDLLIKRHAQKEGLYVECYYYSKWWPYEEHLQQLLRKIDENLSINRPHNVAIELSKNPFRQGVQFDTTFGQLAEALTPVRLAELRNAAQETSPQTVIGFGQVEIWLKGEGYYGGRPNAQGDPEYSFPVYIDEIIEAKKDRNNLKGSRPNILMANAMSWEFQFGFAKSICEMHTNRELPSSLDEVWISVCTFDGKLEYNKRTRKILRNDYAGSGL